MPRALLIAVAFACACASPAARAEPRTVCTITVNSADEKEAFRQRLPPDRYRFVELVEKGRGDWLRSSCASAIRCDVLVVSGHFNAGDTFYSDRLGVDEHLRIDELERASCSDSCPALFSRLKEVYLFGCESLNPGTARYASTQGDSGLGRMRRIFAGVPLIYGFSGSAPVGPTAAMLLNRHFDAAPNEIGSGRPNPELMRVFARNHMTATRGQSAQGDPAEARRRICQFHDDRLAPSRKLALIHAMMQRGMAEARAHFERIEVLLASLTEAERQAPAFGLALATISADQATRGRYLAAARAAGPAPLRSRMLALAATLGWLSPEERSAELVALIRDILASRSIGYAEVDLVCSIEGARNLSPMFARMEIPPARADRIAAAAVLACVGDTQARARVLAALASADDRLVQVAQAYLRHRPVSDAKELLEMTRDVAAMSGTGAQVRALDALGRLRLTDRAIFDELARSFALATSVNVQRAIAEVFLRSGLEAIAHPDLLGVLRRHRIRAAGGEDLIDVLIRRLQASA